jgi:hypothetical protein
MSSDSAFNNPLTEMDSDELELLEDSIDIDSSSDYKPSDGSDTHPSDFPGESEFAVDSDPDYLPGRSSSSSNPSDYDSQATVSASGLSGALSSVGHKESLGSAVGIPNVHGDIQEDGALRQTWLADSNLPCPIAGSTLTHTDLSNGGWRIIREATTTPLMTAEFAEKLGMRAGRGLDYVRTTAIRGDNKSVCTSRGGFLIIHSITNRSGPDVPHVSEICLAIYKQDHPVSDLYHIIVENIKNEGTERFIVDVIQPGEEEYNVYEYNTPMYQALLGTPVGKTVAAMVLGAFPRGTAKIARIHFVVDPWYGQVVHLAFDLEDVENV